MPIINTVTGGNTEPQLVSIDNAVTEFPQTFSPPTGYDGLSSVTVQAPANFKASNIKKDVEIAGVTGTYEPYLQTKSVQATEFPTIVEPDMGVDGMNSVSVTAPANLEAENIAHGVTIAGVVGTYNSFLPELSAQTLTTLKADDFYGMSGIPSHFLDGQYSLTEVELPEGIIGLLQYSFYSCHNLSVVKLPSTLEYINPYCFAYCERYRPDVSGCPNLREYGDYCFRRCGCNSQVEDWSFTFPNAESRLASGMFGECTKLKSVDMSRITSSMAFWDAKGPFISSGIESVIMPEVSDDAWYELAVGLFYFATELKSIEWPAFREIPAKTFTGCSSLSSVTIAEGNTTIGRGAFGGCYALKSITLPSTTGWIYEYAFGYPEFENYSPAQLNDSYDTNKNWVNGYCGITNITIPANANFVDYCFCGAKDLVSVVMLATKPPDMQGTHVFEDTNSSLVITVPKGCLEAYQTATNWSAYADIMVEASE